MKNFISLFLLLFSLATSFAQDNYCVNTEKLNLRDAPSSSGSNVIAQYPQGQQVVVFEINGDWASVYVNGKSGYMWQAYLVKCDNKANTSIFNNENTSAAPPKTTTSSSDDSNDEMVIICNSPNAYAYHRHNCRGLARCSYGTSQMSRKKAISMGRTACKNCY